MLQGRLRPALTVVAILVGVFLKSEVAVADMAATELAAVSGAAGRLARLTSLPAILSDADLAAYRQAFEHQRLGQWSAADRDISHLENPILVGHLLAARYLTPGYRASGDADLHPGQIPPRHARCRAQAARPRGPLQRPLPARLSR